MIKAVRSIVHGNSNVDQAFKLYKKLSNGNNKPNQNKNKSNKPNQNKNKSNKPNQNKNKSNKPKSTT